MGIVAVMVQSAHQGIHNTHHRDTMLQGSACDLCEQVVWKRACQRITGSVSLQNVMIMCETPFQPKQASQARARSGELRDGGRDAVDGVQQCACAGSVPL